MTVSMASFILLICSVMTGLIVEGIKKMFHIARPNILAAVVSVIVGIAVPVAFIIVSHETFSITSVLYIVSIVVLSWLCAMLGYDKVIQTIAQIGR